MKKFVAILMAMLMVLTCALGCAEPVEKEVLASWALVAQTDADGNEIPGEVPMFYVTVYKDGTGTYDLNDGNDAIGKVTPLEGEDGFTLEILDNYFDFVLDAKNGYLVQENPEDGSKMIFAPECDMPVEINAESMADFEGNWHVIAVVQSGFYRDITDMDPEVVQDLLGAEEIAFEIKDGKVMVDGNEVGTVRLVDGALEMTTIGGNVVTVCLDECNDITFPVDIGNVTAVYAARK